MALFGRRRSWVGVKRGSVPLARIGVRCASACWGGPARAGGRELFFPSQAQKELCSRGRDITIQRSNHKIKLGDLRSIPWHPKLSGPFAGAGGFDDAAGGGEGALDIHVGRVERARVQRWLEWRVGALA